MSLPNGHRGDGPVAAPEHRHQRRTPPALVSGPDEREAPEPDDEEADMVNGDDGGGEVQEPDNSTVEDWLGQDVARDEEVADKAVAENDTLEEAEAQFNDEAEGKETHDLGYPRPEGDPEPGGDSP